MVQFHLHLLGQHCEALVTGMQIDNQRVQRLELRSGLPVGWSCVCRYFCDTVLTGSCGSGGAALQTAAPSSLEDDSYHSYYVNRRLRV